MGIRDGTDLPRGVRSRVRERSARGQLRPRVTCRLRAAAAAPAQAAALLAPHCRPRASGCLHDLALSVHVLFPLSPRSLLSPPSPFRLLLYLVFSFSKSRCQALQVRGGSFLPRELFLCLVVAVVATAGRSSSSASPAPPSSPRPRAPAACWCNAQAAWVRPKPAGLLSMPNCPAGVALASRVLARLRRPRLLGGEGAQLCESPASSSGGLPEDARLTHPPSPGTRVP